MGSVGPNQSHEGTICRPGTMGAFEPRMFYFQWGQLFVRTANATINISVVFKVLLITSENRMSLVNLNPQYIPSEDHTRCIHWT